MTLLLAAALALPSPSPTNGVPRIVNRNSTINGKGWTGLDQQLEAFFGERHVTPFSVEERRDLIFAYQDKGALAEILTIKFNGDIVLRGKKIGHDAGLGKMIQHGLCGK